MITTDQIKELRDKTNISIAECKKALEQSAGDMAKAVEILKAAGAQVAEKKSSRTLKAGAVSAYVHSTGNLGAMVALQAETDFVAKHSDFKNLADDIAMHIAAMEPADKDTLLTQPFIKDPALTIDDLIKQATQKFGERIDILRFVRVDISAAE